MAIFRPGVPIGAISGNLGGLNFVLSKNGPVVRPRIRRTKATTPQAHNQRQIFSFLRKSWRALTDNQRTAWRQAALAHPRRNRLGYVNRITGYQLFLQLNAFWATVRGQKPILTFTDPPKLVNRQPFIIESWSATSGGSKIFTSNAPLSIPPGPASFAIYGARTFSSATRRFWNSFRFIQTVFTQPNMEITSGWNFSIGDPVQGEQCWISTVQFAVDQLPGTPQVRSAIAQ